MPLPAESFGVMPEHGCEGLTEAVREDLGFAQQSPPAVDVPPMGSHSPQATRLRPVKPPCIRAAVAFAPESFAQLGMQGLPALVPLDDPALRTHLNIIWPRHPPLPPAAERLKSIILERFASMNLEES